MQKLHLSRYNLLLILLIAFPALLTLCYAVMIVTQHWHTFGMEVPFLAFVYSFAATFIIYRYKISSGTLNTNRIFAWSLIRGIAFGLVFFFLFFLPVGMMELSIVYHNILYLRVIEGWLLNATILGVVFGGAAGGILGLFLPRRQASLSH